MYFWHRTRKSSSTLAKLLVLVMLLSLSVPSMPAHAAADDTVNAYGYNISNQFKGGWSKGNLGPTYAEGEWVAFQTELKQVDWANLDNLGVRFDFYDNDAVFYDLIRNISVGTELLADDHGFPMANGEPYVIHNEASANMAQRESEEYYFNGFAPIILSPTEYMDQINRGNDGSDGSIMDNTRTFYVTKAQILEALNLEEGVDELPVDVVLYFQMHLARTWIWNNLNNDNKALAFAYDQAPTDKWGGYIYGDSNFLPEGFTAFGAAEYPGSSGHSYVFLNNGESGEKTLPIPNVEETLGTISGHKYLDANGNGVYDEGDEPLPGWEIFLRTDLYAIEDIEFSKFTDENGYYEFTNLPYNLIWELSEEEMADFTETYPMGDTPSDGSYMEAPDPENDFWAVPWDVEGDSTYDGYGRAPYGWSVKLAPPSHLVRENMDFMNANLGALKITKLFINDRDYELPDSIDVEVIGPSYPGPEGSIESITIDQESGYGELILFDLIPGEYEVTEVTMEPPFDHWDPIVSGSPALVEAGSLNDPVVISIENIDTTIYGLIDGRKVDENGLPMINSGLVFEFEIFEQPDMNTPIAYGESDPVDADIDWSLDGISFTETLELVEGMYYIREVTETMPAGYEYLQMVILEGINVYGPFTDEYVAFEIVSDAQLLNFDVFNRPFGALTINKTFVDGLDYIPDSIEVHVTGPEGYDETVVIDIDEFGEGSITLTDLVPGDYFFEEVNVTDDWTTTYDPETQMVSVVPGNVEDASIVSISNMVVPGELIINKTFVDGLDYIPDSIEVHVTGPEGYDETVVIDIDEFGEGSITLSDLVPGEYYFEEVNVSDDWEITYDPISQMVEVLPGGTNDASIVSISNMIVPGELIINKTFVDGLDYIPDSIEVHVTGPEGYDETVVINIDGFGEGSITLSDLVPGEYFFEEVNVGDDWETTYDPVSQTVEVLSGGTNDASIVSISNEIVPADLRITKQFTGGEDFPGEISVRVTGPEGYDEVVVIPIDGSGYGEVTLEDLVPGMYSIDELSFEGSELWTSVGLPTTVEVGPGGSNPLVTVDIINTRVIIEETAYGYPGFDGNYLNDVVKSNKWGWYFNAEDVVLGHEYEVYAGAGGNDISSATLVGTVIFTESGGYYEAEFVPEDSIEGLSVSDGPHFGVYEKAKDIPNSPGRYSNDVSIADAGVLVYHIVIEYPMQ